MPLLLVGLGIGSLGGLFVSDATDNVKQTVLFGLVGLVVWKFVK